GWLNTAIRSVDHFNGIDALGVESDFVVAAYRQYILANPATGIIGATTIDVANGLDNGEIFRHVELNQDLYEGTVGGRYPGAVAIDRPFIHFNQYISGDAETTPALSDPYLITDYGSYGINGGAWTPSIKMDEGYKHWTFEQNRLWDGPVEIVKGSDGNYHYLGAYRNWTIEGESQPYEYVLLNAETDDPTFGWTIDTDPAVIDTMNFFIYPAISLNSSGFGACIGVGHAGPHPGDTFYLSELRLMVMVTYDYGKTWTDVREISWAELGIPEEITAEDSIYVPANPDDPNDTTMVIYEGPAYVAIPNNHSVDVLVTEDNKIYTAFDITWGPWATENSYYRDWHYCGLHLGISTDEGQTFKDSHVAINNGFFVGDESSAEVDDNLFFDSEADISLDENGNIYLTWLDRPNTGIEPAEASRYNNPNEGILLKTDVFTARSIDGGKTWTWKMNVTQTQHVDEYELKAVRKASSRNNGTVWFAYCEVDPNEPVAQGDPDAYTYRTNRVWVGEAFTYPDTGVGIENNKDFLATSHILLRNYPNPFNPTTHIEFRSAQSGRAVLTVYDVSGRLVKKVFDDQVRSNQLYRVEFDARNLSSGLYFYRLNVNGHFTTRKMVLMR
ncbi:MAG TPA: T9SS type A sorting domain-containing protein, partial [Caldithrix abyssi]|nr:T9SS type A sorting domain-containing protein [Caldithrix abyssi]